MRKSNYNFVLTPDTVSEFIKRFTKLIDKTDLLTSQTFYHSLESSNIIRNFKSHNFMDIKKSNKTYILKEKLSFDTYPSTISDMERYDCFNEWKKAEGLIIRVHFDACLIFYWGQKFKFTPTEIKTVGCGYVEKYKIKTNRKSTEIFKICSDIKLAKDVVFIDEQLAHDYYDSLNDLNDFSDFDESDACDIDNIF